MNTIKQSGYYAEYKGKIFRIDDANRNYFLHKYDNFRWVLWGNNVEIPINDPSLVESAYHVETWCAIDGFELRIMNLLDDYYYLQVDSENKKMLEHFGVIFNSRDFLSLNIKRTEEQVPDIWEVHKAIKGFPFKGPDWVILKFEGKWLDTTDI